MRNFKIKKLIILFVILSIPVFAFAGCATGGIPYPAGYISRGNVSGENAGYKGMFIPSLAYSNNIGISGTCYYNGNISVYARADNASGVKLRFADNLNFGLNEANCKSAPKRKADIKLWADVVYYGNEVFPYTKRGAVANGFGGPVKNYKVKQWDNVGGYKCKNQNCGKLIVVDVRTWTLNSGEQEERFAINAHTVGLSPKETKALFVETAVCNILSLISNNTNFNPECVQDPY